MSRNSNVNTAMPPTTGPGANPDLPPTAPHDPVEPDQEPLPVPPDTDSPAPMREPSTPQPAGDPPSSEPMRM